MSFQFLNKAKHARCYTSVDAKRGAAMPPSVIHGDINLSSMASQIRRKPVAVSLNTTNNSSSISDETSSERTNLPVIDSNGLLIPNDPTPEQERYVKWGIRWKTPLLIVVWALVGFGFALGHHLYYHSLDGTKVGSSSRQNWALRFGTALSFLVIASLRATCDAAYKQYIWTLFKRKTFSLDTLDKLFSVTSDPTAFMSWELLRNAKIAFLVAVVCWCMPLAGIAPPATLSVVSGFGNETKPISWPLPDWNSLNFVDSQEDVALPSSEVLQIATIAAQSMAIVPPTAPAANSSLHLQFFGPTLQCSMANSSQQAAFDYYSTALANGSLMTVTKSLFESGKLVWGDYGFPFLAAPLMSVYSAFSPFAGELGWLSFEVEVDDGPRYSPDQFNNWIMDVPPNAVEGWYFPEYQTNFSTQQLWVQTAEKAMVCTLGNTSFDVAYEFVDDGLTIAEYSTSMFEPFWLPFSGEEIAMLSATQDGLGNPSNTTNPDYWNPSNSYMAMFLAFSSLLNGNVSTTLTNSFSSGFNLDADEKYIAFDGNVTIYDSSSKVLQYGLSACDDFVHGYWNKSNTIGIGEDGPVPWQNASASIDPIPSSTRFKNISNDLFTKPAWMCRNRTLLRAIEDLANNITISMLSSTNLIKQNATTVNVLYFPTQNIYKYDSRNLILSYSIALLFTILCANVGFFALRYNGVAHSTAFSAIIATTRNRQLDALSKGQSLGALPLEHTSIRLRFGELVGEGKTAWDSTGLERRIGFGIASNVLSLKKGGKYV